MKHRWALSWPGNYCKDCGMDEPIESAICCPDCLFDYPPPCDCGYYERSFIDVDYPNEHTEECAFIAFEPEAPKLCAHHQVLVDRPCTYKMVVHCMRADYDVYCGRGKCPKTGKVGEWGNPYVIGPDGDRKEVIAKFIDLASSRPEVIEKIKRELKGKVLGCWCVPQDCHCYFLARVANS
jgi:hypothetical protein